MGQNIVSKNSCDATGCTSGGVSMPCGQVCKRGCKKCDEGTCKDVGSIFGKGNDFCTQIKNNGLCDKTDASCGKESCGDLCRKTCDKFLDFVIVTMVHVDPKYVENC